MEPVAVNFGEPLAAKAVLEQLSSNCAYKSFGREYVLYEHDMEPRQVSVALGNDMLQLYRLRFRVKGRHARLYPQAGSRF